jgi:hypothetical protein
VGIRLIVEVLISAPMVLTHREKLLLVALAEDANDDTRVTWNSIEHPKFQAGAKLSSRAQLYAVIKALTTKGVLTKTSAGQKNGVAKYKLERFAAAQCQEIPDTEPAPQRPENADTDTPQRPKTPDTEGEGQCQETPDTETSQCQGFRDVSVRDSGTPTPLNPSSTTPSASQQGSQPATALSFGIPDDARPLVDGLTSAGVIVRWPFKGSSWFPVLSMIAKSGVPAMVDHARRAAARTDVQSANYFLKGWGELPPLPAPGTERPPLRAVSGGWTPFKNPSNQDVYDEDLI